jgi:hypothetical protein
MRWFIFLLVVGLTLIAPLRAQSVGFGWSGTSDALSGIPRKSTDIWTARTSWSDVAAVGWPYVNSDFTSFVAANPNAITDFATALIPHDLPSAGWNAMLDEVTSGVHDSVFVTQGQTMAQYGSQTVYCRPWWEMTMDVSNLDPAKFQAAWNHAIPIIRAAFAAAAPNKTLKIAYCYLPNAAGDPMVYFPGPTNVDVIDADIYGKVWGTTTPTQAAMISSVQGDLEYLASFAAQYNKPMGISEWGNFAIQPQGVASNQGRGDEPAYIDTMFSFAQQHHFLYMVYFNIPDGGVNQTLADTPLSLARIKFWTTPQIPVTPPPAEALSDEDIGDPAMAGSAVTSGNTITLQGGGYDIWNQSDQFNYDSESLTGDATMVVHVDSTQKTDPWWAKAGLMFRNSSEPDAAYVGLYENPSGLVEMQWRDVDAGQANYVGQVGQFNSANWLELVKTGDNFSAYYATTTGTPTASDWVPVGTHTTSFTETSFLGGLAVTAHNDAALNTTVFSGFSLH